MLDHPEAAANRIHEVFDTAVAAGLRADSVTGSSDAEIDGWAVDQGARTVPLAVRAILKLIGQAHGLWLPGSSLGVDAVRRDAKKALLATLMPLGDAMTDPEGALVLVEHQSYPFHVVDGVDLDLCDPPVWLVTEGEKPEKQWESASFWFRTITPDIARYRERLEVMRELDRQRVPDWAQYIEAR